MPTKVKTNPKIVQTKFVVARTPVAAVPSGSPKMFGHTSILPIYALTIFLGAFLLFQVQLV